MKRKLLCVCCMILMLIIVGCQKKSLDDMSKDEAEQYLEEKFNDLDDD